MSTDFGFNCTAGGKWYACSSGSRFVGCCTSDPCSNTGCVQGNVRPAGFNPAQFNKFPDASCGSASNFFTCTAGNTFWGCCKTNPCAATPAATCPGDSLVPAFLERPEQLNVYAPNSSQSSSPSSTPNSDNGSNKGAIIGGAVGGAAALIIVALLAFFCLRRRRRSQQSTDTLEVGGASSASAPMMGEKRDHQRLSDQYGVRSPPPMYAEPNSNFPHPDPTGKGHYQHNYQQYSYDAAGPSELPAESPSVANVQRYSELPAEPQTGANAQRYSDIPIKAPKAPTGSHSAPNGQKYSDMPARASELPGDAIYVASELKSPHTTPKPQQAELSPKQEGLPGTEAAKATRE